MMEATKYSINESFSNKNELTPVSKFTDFDNHIDLYNSSELKSKVFNITGFTAAFALLIPNCNAINHIKQQQITPTVDIINTYLDRDKIVNDYTSFITQDRVPNRVSFGKIISDILSYQALKRDWDGYGAYSLENTSGVNSISVLEKLGEDIYQNIYDYYPNPNGTLSLEWKNNNKFLGLEIGNEEFSYFYKKAKDTKLYYNNILFEKNNIDILKENLIEMFS